MYVFVELWKPKQSWIDLPQPERAQFMEKLGPAIQSFLDAGMEIISWSLNDAETALTTDHIYIGVYKFPNKEEALRLEQVVDESGWYNYFDQINAKGPVDTPDSIIGHMIGYAPV